MYFYLFNKIYFGYFELVCYSFKKKELVCYIYNKGFLVLSQHVSL